MKAQRSAQEPEGAPGDGANSRSKRWFKRPWSIVTAVGIVGAAATALTLPGKFSQVPENIDPVKDQLSGAHAHEVSGTRIGEFEFTQDSSVAAAIEAFGPPSSRKSKKGKNRENIAVDSPCIVEWRNLGLTAQFVRPYEDACSKGYLCFAQITGDEWETANGLRVGDSAAKLVSLYPETAAGGGMSVDDWKLESGIKGCSLEDGLHAVTDHHRVSSFDIYFFDGPIE
jgi:hypothetical protein